MRRWDSSSQRVSQRPSRLMFNGLKALSALFPAQGNEPHSLLHFSFVWKQQAVAQILGIKFSIRMILKPSGHKKSAERVQTAVPVQHSSTCKLGFYAIGGSGSPPSIFVEVSDPAPPPAVRAVVVHVLPALNGM